MKKIFLVSLVMFAMLSGAVFADDDFEKLWKRSSEGGHRGGAVVENALYQKECGTCHMAYQPNLLSSSSWGRLMDTLADHFGDNAELGAQEQAQIRDYLVQNSAGRSSRFADSGSSLRITESRYFIRKHDEVPLSIRRGQGQVKSMSNCDACHTNAKQGSYSEHEIRIPGRGRWED